MVTDSTARGDQPAYVTVPVEWNDADRDAGIDWWIANATYWYEQAQQNYRQRDHAADLQRRIDRTVRYLLELLDGPLDSVTAVVANAVIEGLTLPVVVVPSRYKMQLEIYQALGIDPKAMGLDAADTSWPNV